MDSKLTRRSFLGAAGAGVASMSLCSVVEAAAISKKSRMLRVAHLTDLHIMPELDAAKWMETCVHHAQSQKIDLILYGGDLIFDASIADKDRVKAQWDLFNRVNRSEVGVPMKYCLGNHDVWGWGNRTKFASEASFGKRSALDALGMDRSYYSFDSGGWKFIVLDSIHSKEGNGYTAQLGRDQAWWLIDTLRKTPKTQPVLVLSHCPILSVAPYLFGDHVHGNNWAVPGMWMHTDARFIKDVFRRHTNVNLCLSGHMHMVDRVDFNGVTYLCNGAVCGNWWKGKFQEFTPSYTLIDLFSDGTYEWRAIPYGWKPA